MLGQHHLEGGSQPAGRSGHEAFHQPTRIGIGRVPLPPQRSRIGTPGGHPRKQRVEAGAGQHLQGTEAERVEIELRPRLGRTEPARRVGDLRSEILLASGDELKIAVDQRAGVGELEAARPVEQKIDRLDLAMQPAAGMQGLQALEGLGEPALHLASRHRLASDPRSDAFVGQFQNHPVPLRVGAVHRQQPLVSQVAHRLDAFPELAAQVIHGAVLILQHLDGDVSLERAVIPRPVHLRPDAFAELLENAVMRVVFHLSVVFQGNE